MTKKTKLHKHAHNLIQGKEHHHGAITRGSVAASVAIASTLAIASVAQAEPLEKPAALEGAHTNSNSSTPAQGAQKGKHTQGANQGAAQGTVQNAAQDAAQGTSHNGENKPTSGDALNSTTPQSLTAHNTADSAPQSQNGAQTQQAGDKPGTPNLSDKTQAPAGNKEQEQPEPLPNSDQVITPNTKNPDPTTKEDANQQVEREKDSKKTYTFTVSYSVEGYRQKQLLQPTEFTFTEDELTKISDPNGDGLYIPVATTKGYNAERGQYIKKDGKYVLDTEKNASIQTYIKIDRALIEGNKNTITSTKTHIVSAYTIEYRPKTVTYYVRHMLQDPENPDKFKEYTHVSDVIDVNNEEIHVSKTKGVVGQSLYAQPITVEGYSPEPNLVNSPIPDDDDYVDADAGNPSSANNKKKHLVLELRYLLNKHEVSYDTKGGTAIQAKTFYYGMKVDAVPEPTRKGYKFDGWTRETPNKTAADVNSSTPNKDANATLLEKMPDSNVKFVAHWKPEKEKAEYHINIWVQKADLPKPDDPTNMDNYDFIGQVQKEGKSDGTIQDADLNLTDDQIAHIAWPDSKLRGTITNEDDFNKYFMEDDASKAKTQALNNVEEPEYFGAPKEETRLLTKIRPDGTTVVNKVFNRRVYELIFANPDIVQKDGTSKQLFDKVNHTTITKGDKTYDDRNKDKLYTLHYRFGQTVHYTNGFPTDTETKRYQDEDETDPLGSLGWLVANDANEYFYVDTPPYRFDLKHFIAPQKDNVAFSQDNIRLFGEKLGPYQRVLLADGSAASKTHPIHTFIKLETEESARRNDDNDREYALSELSYTKYDTSNKDYDFSAPTIEGYEVVPDDAKQKQESVDKGDYYEKIEDYLQDEWNKDHNDEDLPDYDDEEFEKWIAKKFPRLKYVYMWPTDTISDNSDHDPNVDKLDGTQWEKNGYLCFRYRRKKASVNFAVDQVTPIQDAQGTRASTQEPYNTNLKKFATDYNDAVKQDAPAEGTRYANSYTFTIGGKTYTFKRPDSLPEDYEFAGWSLDPAGTQKLAPRKEDGTLYTSQEIAELLKKTPEEIAKVLGNTPLETGGITLYASWKRVNTVHTIDVDMDRKDAPVHTLVKVTHGQYAKIPPETVQDSSAALSQDRFPKPSPRPGYMFTGWLQKYTGADGSEQWLPFAFTSPILEDLQIKAQWIEDKRVTGTVSHVFLREGYTVAQYKQAKQQNNTELLKKMVADEQVTTISNLRPRSSYAAEAAYRNDNYYPDHTYTTIVVSSDEANNRAEFIYTPYATRRYTVYFKDKAGNELAAPEVFVSNKLSYDVAHAKVIPGYRLPNDTPLARQLNFTDARNTAYIKPDANGNYSVEFIYDDVRVLTRTLANAPQPKAYSRVQFNTETSELTMQDGKVITTTSTTDGGALAAFNGTTTGDKNHPLQQLIFDVVKGTKAYEMPLPVPHAREGYTFTGWTSQVVFNAGEKAAEGANRLPVFSEEFPYQVIYTAHFKKTKIQFKDTDPKAQPPEGYYKVTYSADQNGRLKRTVPNEQGGTKDEILDTLTNVVVLNKYKDNVIDAPVAVPDKGFTATEGFSFEGKDEKDRTYTKHFEMIEPTAVAKRYVLPGHTLLQPGQTARDLVDNHDAYADTDDATTGAQAATYEFCDEKGNAATLDDTTVGEHKVFIKVTAGREHSRVYKIVPFFYEVLPEMSFGEEFNAHGYTDDITGHYKKITFRSNANEGELIGKDRTKSVDDNKTLETYVYTGESASGNYKLDMPSAVGNDYHDDGYHYVFRGWRKVGAHAQTTPVNDFKTFKADIAAKERYHTIEKPKQDVVYEAVYEKIPYIVTKVTDGTIPEDSVVVSFKPAPGRKWADGSTGPKVLYIKKGMDISRLDEHGVPIKDNDTTTKSILQVLGSQLAGYESDWTKSSMDGITLIKSMKDGAGADGWKSNNAFQEFVAHQKAHTEPKTIEQYQAIIQNTQVPTANDFIKNDQALKDLLMKNGVAIDGKENIESYNVEFVGKAPQSKVAGTYLVPLKVTIKYRDMDSESVFMLNSQLKVIYGVLYGKNKPSEAKQPIDYKVFNGNYRKVTFITDDNEKNQHKGTIIGDEDKNSVDYYVAKNQELKVRVPKMLNQDYVEDGYHYKFVGWKLVPTADTAVKDDKHELTDTDIKFGTSNADSLKVTKTAGDLIYKAVYEKIKYVENKPVDGTVPADSVVVSFKPAPGRTWKDGSAGPKVLYIKKGMDISRLDENGVPIKDGDHTTKSILQVLGEKLDGYASDWTKSSMDGITLIKSMKTGAGADGWKSNNAFQEFVAHQTPYVEPEAVSEFTIAQNGTVPTLEEFVKNLAQLKGNNIAKDDQGKPIFKIETIGQMPTSKVAATYTIPWTVTLKHADMSDTITYKCTTVLRVMGNVYNATDAKTMIDSIAASETPDTTTGKSTPLTPAQEQFKKSYARVVFDSDDKGTLSGGDTDTTLTRYVKTNTDINLSIPGVNPHQKLDDHDGKGEYDYLFDHWEIQVNPTGESAGASNGEARHAAAHKRGKRSVDVFPQTMLFAAHGAGADAPTEGNTIVAGATNETLAASLRRLKRQFAETYPQATYVIIARYKKVYYVTPAKDVNSIPAGFVPVVAFPAPGHTWEDGSVDPDIYYVKSGESYGDKRKSWEKGLANLRGWKYLGASGKQITDPAALATIDRPTKALTLIAEQYDLPELKPKNDLVITEGDLMPSYNEMVQDTPQINPETGQLLLEPNSQNPAMINGVEAFSTLKLNPRFAGWETDRDSYAKLSTDKPGIYRVRFGLKYYTDEQELDPQTKQPLHENGKIKHKVAIKWVEANVHILPRVIAEQDLPADDTREAQFMKANYTKVTYRVALGDHGFLASPNTTFYVRRGYTIDPNALLNFDKDKRAKRLQEMQKHVVDEKQLKQEIGVPSAIAQPGYVFYEWQKHAANDQGDVVYLAHFHKLPITHFEFETSTEAEQSFSTRLIGDAQNYPTYKPKAGTTLPEGVTVTCKGDTCTVSGTPHITDWTNGETQRTIELTFEAVDTRDPDKYGRSSYGLKKEITVRIVVKRPHATTGGSHGGGSYGGGSYGGGESIPWTELTPAVEAPATPAPTPTPAEAPAPAPARPRARAARHARLPQTGDSQLAATAAEILGMGAGMISLVAGARKKKRKHEDRNNENKN